MNYIRNSVKISIDAYTGETTFYLIDPADPIAATYARIFPDLFRPAEAMPQSLRDHWRYPETLYLYQSRLYATYHMRDPQVFYNREDLWDIPEELVETSQQPMEPYYVTMRVPNSDNLEFMLIRPYVPKQKQNMVAWLYADCDGDDYGELGIVKLAKDRLVGRSHASTTDRVLAPANDKFPCAARSMCSDHHAIIFARRCRYSLRL